MPSVVHTPRDRLQRLLDYAVRATRYWWLLAGFVIVGGALSVVFALTREHRFQSSSTILYQERIQSSVLQGRDASTVQRNIGDLYRELLLSRAQLATIIRDKELNPFEELVEEESEEVAIEELRRAIRFEVRGNSAFRIVYTDSNAQRAQAVTQRLTDLLIAKDSELQIQNALATAEFAEKELEKGTAKLLAKEQERAQFLVENPEFAEDEMQGQGEGAAVRRQKDDDDKATASGSSNPRLNALQRQRNRIKARLDAADRPVTAPPPRDRTPTVTEQAAQRKVDQAEDEVRDAQRDLGALRDQGKTDNHPDVKKAKDRIETAERGLATAKAELKSAKDSADSVVEVKPPANENERAELEKQLRDVEAQIAAERRTVTGTKEPTKANNDIADKVVALEARWSRLRRELAEETDRVEDLNQRVFRAQLDAQTRLADSGSSLQVVDPAYLPKKAVGKGKKILVLAGLFIFTALGLALAVGLAIIDDRIYRRVDLEQLDIAPVLGVIPRRKRGAR